MRTDSDTLLDAGRDRATPVYTTEERDGIPFLVDSNGRARSLEHFCAAPIRTRGFYRARRVEDALKFISRHRTGNSVIFWKPSLLPPGGTAVAYIDFHSPEGTADFCQFVVKFRTSREGLTQTSLPVFEGEFKPAHI